ncbi:MAG: APC family permease [bacterium]
MWRHLVGAPRSLTDRSLFHRLSLVPILAWVGLGADGLSSSSYGPEEAYRTLGSHTYLAILLAAATAGTVLIISAAYARIIEDFPHGGGGYVVATKTLGARAGVVSGAALLVDYMLTIAMSIAAAGDALFSFLPMEWHVAKLPIELLFVAGLTTLNLRGIRESILVLTPIFLLFLLTHAPLILGGLLVHAPEFPRVATEVASGFQQGLGTLGVVGLLLLFVHAYSLGGGTYTGIEAVSNGLPIMREPHVQTGKRTMGYMAASLAITATGLLLCYLLWNVSHEEGKTLNAVLVERVTQGLPFGGVLVLLTLISEGALLLVAAQTGFVDGPRVLANMAIDSWMPRRFAALSDRLTAHNGILLMAGASVAALAYTRGNVHHLVVMYSINVFLTFSLSMLGMAREGFRTRRRRKGTKRRLVLFVVGFLLCATILAITIVEKFLVGGWITLAATGSLIGLCFLIRRHYRKTAQALSALYAQLDNLRLQAPPNPRALDPDAPTAAVLVGSYGGVGIHTTFNIFRVFPGHFRNLVFITVGVIDSGGFKGEDAIDRLRAQTDATVAKYQELARGMGIPSTSRTAIATDAVEASEKLCLAVLKDFPSTTFFSGQVIFQRERWYQRLLHNETAFAIQKRLQWRGQTMVILPARVTVSSQAPRASLVR